MKMKAIDIIATLILNVIHCVYTSDDILSCNATALDPCPHEGLICDQKSNRCLCKDNFVQVGDTCVEREDKGMSTHSATAIVIGIFTLALLVVALVLVVRKYNLVEYARQRFLRRNNDVMYEDVMIGQDDPPLSP